MLVRGVCYIIGVTSLESQQRVYVQLSHGHDGMGLRRFTEEVATAARLSSAALAHTVLARVSYKAQLFRGAVGHESHVFLAWFQQAWRTVLKRMCVNSSWSSGRRT